MDFPLTVRIPLIPGVNTECAQIEALCDVLLGPDIRNVLLLKYNHLWEAKIPRLNTQQNFLNFSADDFDYDKVLANFIHSGINAKLSE